jgi:hypothetical protein
MLDSPEGVCAGQAGFEYPATFVLFSNFLRCHGQASTLGPRTLLRRSCATAPTRSACTGAICTGTWRPLALAQAQAQGRVPSTRLLVHGFARVDQDGLHCYLTTQPDVSASIHRPE